MFTYSQYRHTCSQFIHSVLKGRLGVNLGGNHLMGGSLLGQQVIVDTRHPDSFVMLFCPPVIESSIFALFHHMLKMGMVCVDIGSGCGYYAITMGNIVGYLGKVYAFEPIPECCELIEKNARMNDLQTIFPANFSIGDRLGKKKITYFGEDYQFFFQKADDNAPKEAECSVTSLNIYLKGVENTIDFININTQNDLPLLFAGMSDLVTSNLYLCILCRFNRELLISQGYLLEEFLKDIRANGLKIFILPSLEPVDDATLLKCPLPKYLLLSRQPVCSYV